MITTQRDGYCVNCAYFKPKVHKKDYFCYDTQKTESYVTHVDCKYSKLCKRVADYISNLPADQREAKPIIVTFDSEDNRDE